MKKVVFTQHTEDTIRERELDPQWIVRTAIEPEWTTSDPFRAGVERRYRAIPEHGDRILRVACFETETELRIVTAFFDRGARKQR